MAPTKRRPATPESTAATPVPEGPDAADPPPSPPPVRRGRGRLPDVPAPPPKRGRVPAPDVSTTPPAATEGSTQLLGPDGEPVAQEASTGDAGGDPAPPTEARQAAAEDGPTTRSPGRSPALYAQRVWPD